MGAGERSRQAFILASLPSRAGRPVSNAMLRAPCPERAGAFQLGTAASARETIFPASCKMDSRCAVPWGCLAWQKEGLEPPAAVENATREYEEESDMLGDFLEDCCETGQHFRVAKGELWNAYEKWCSAHKERRLSRKAFPNRMKARGFGEWSDGAARYWTGLRLRPDGTDATNGTFQKFPIEQPSMGKSEKEGQVVSVASAEAQTASPIGFVQGEG
jgi:Poxvirus D5 protein-like